MKHSKRVRTSFALAMAIGMLMTGCGSSEQKEITQSESATTQTSSESTKPSESKKVEKAETTIDEQVLVDANDVKITAKGFEKGGFMGDELKLLIENNSSEDIIVQLDALIVNDYMVNDLFSEDVAAGKKANAEVNLLSSELESAGIDNIGQIEMRFKYIEPDTFHTFYTTDLVSLKTNQFDQMDTTPNDDGKELYNANGFRIVGKYVEEDTVWGNAVILYLENNTDQNVTFQCEDMSVNGFMVNPIFSSTVYPHKKAVSDITLFESNLEENGIESVDDIELTFRILNSENFSEIIKTEPIAFSAH